MDILVLIFTSFLSIVALFIVTKIMGHKQVSQFDFFDYVSGITIGSIGAELATNLEEFWKPLVALIIYCLVSVILRVLAQKFPKTRKYINGTPTILMSQGKLYRKNFKKAKLELTEFMLMCRELGYFNLNEIEIAIFEHNGKLSVMPKPCFRPATPDDLKITVKPTNIGTEIIMDGRIMGENISRIGKDIKWLQYQLKLQGFNSAKEIFLGIYFKEDNSLLLYKTNQ